jgi:transcriptional regulator with XRE-family HTH domain
MKKEDLRKLLIEYNITQKKLAGLLDLDPSTITRWMNGSRNVSMSREIAIMAILRKKWAMQSCRKSRPNL